MSYDYDDYNYDDYNYDNDYSDLKESESLPFTHGVLQCPYCSSNYISTYIDGTAECDRCGKEFRYWR